MSAWAWGEKSRDRVLRQGCRLSDMAESRDLFHHENERGTLTGNGVATEKLDFKYSFGKWEFESSEIGLSLSHSKITGYCLGRPK